MSINEVDPVAVEPVDQEQKKFNSSYFNLMKAALFYHVNTISDYRFVFKNGKESEDLIESHEYTFDSVESKAGTVYLKYTAVRGSNSYVIQFNIYQSTISGIIGNYLMRPESRAE